jgi:hypothetical protein
MKLCNRKKLIDISNIRTGYAVRGKLISTPKGTMSILQMKDVNVEGISWNTLARIQPISEKKTFFLQQEDVIFCGRGTKIFATALNKKPEKVVAGQQFFVITPKEGIPADYIAWYINSSFGQKYFWKYAGGSSIINVTRIVLENCPICFPEFDDLRSFTALLRAAKKEIQVFTDIQNRRQYLLENIVAKGIEEA